MTMTYTFIVDGMLGKLAKWLRILGYSTYYGKNDADEKLLEIASNAGAILLTRDRQLENRARNVGLNAICMPEDVGECLKELHRLGYISLKIDLNETRCPLCNTKLKHIAASVAKNLAAPPYVVKRYNVVLYCPKCAKFYWPGSHYINMLNFLQRINRNQKLT